MSQLFSILGIRRPAVPVQPAARVEDPAIARSRFAQDVEEVSIELSNFCNRQCYQCPREQVRKRDARNIDRELLEKILADLSLIDFSGTLNTHLYNEPLYDPEYWIGCYRIIKQYLPRCKVAIATNGDYLTTALLERLIALGVDVVNVTLYYTAWDPRKQHARLAQFMKRLGIEGEITSVHYGVFFKEQIDRTALHIRSVDFEKAGQDRGGLITEGVNRLRRSTPCGLPANQFNINFDGEVFPCCNVYPRKENNAEYAMGSVRDHSVFQIYSGGPYAQFRQTVEAISGEDSDMPDCCRFCTDPRSS